MQDALTHARSANRAAANLSARFYQDIKFWRNLCVNMADRPTYLAELVYPPTYDLGYNDASGLVSGGGYG